MRLTALLLTALLGAAVAVPLVGHAESQPAVPADHTAMEDSLEDVRQALRIPGMAAAVVQDQKLIWAKGFGYADLEDEIAATPATPFGLASVTKPIAATLIMQLVEEGAIDLDARVSTYGVDVPDGAEVTVRHLLTHTSEGTPGRVHRYNGNRYGLLGGVIEGATGKTFAQLLGDEMLVPLAMSDTALNPLNSWGGLAVNGLEEFWYGLGWGAAFRHYPDVYARLAEPYQFDDDYELIPGMYHLIHNPAAGLISSVNDVAKFDIALDRGLLLGDAAMMEMHTPAIPTVGGRSDLAYGLGWYVQEFGGVELLWHAGRWAPSNSALYVKVPDENLTFIVLANTDNLTVPFPGIGDGDLARSTPALTFFRHFVFPRQHGYDLPPIDWTAGETQAISQLAAVDDEASLAFLERELWSYRQAYASSGQHEQAEVLRRVGLAAFPDSTLVSDPSYTAIAGKTPIASPGPTPRTFVSLSRVVLVWLIIVVASLVWMAVERARAARTTVWDWAVWLAATVLLGPIAPLVHRLVRSQTDAGPVKRQVISASLFCITGYAAAWVLAVIILLNLGDDPNGLAILAGGVLIPFTIGLLLVKAPLLHRAGIRPYRKAASRGVVAEIITWSLGFAVLFSLTLYMDNRWLSFIPYPTSPYFWAMLSVFSMAGLVVFIPLHYELQRRGFSIWFAAATVRDGASTVAPRLPTLRNSWSVLLLTIAISIVVLGFAVSTFA